MDGHVSQNHDAILLGDSLGFMLIPSFPHLNTKLFADLPVHVCSCLVVAVDVFSFSQFRAARDQMVNGLVETAIKSAFWVTHVRLLEDVVLVPACGEAFILGLLLVVVFPFCGHLHDCLSSLTALPSKTICDMRHLQVPIERIRVHKYYTLLFQS